ncbi:polysaccharide deacetylase family protein [Bradyrhizobium sp. CIR3A]|uniref:polysaccharide deacetylase family protein n=1 Tax=Bradyrhizobium sp. CIR3A TaxID=2663838 RepID=UPI00289AAFBD|nr:polysaccharide deacetylase family protein [Bradyrhizobium sp. CIR3A]
MPRRRDVRTTFFVPALSALLHEDEQRQVAAEGHEIGVRGWIHELNAVLPYAAERDLMFRSSDALESVTGIRPVGLRTPSWDFSSIEAGCTDVRTDQRALHCSPRQEKLDWGAKALWLK